MKTLTLSDLRSAWLAGFMASNGQLNGEWLSQQHTPYTKERADLEALWHNWLADWGRESIQRP